MSQADVRKVERISSPTNAALWVDLMLDVRDGMFFAEVGGKRVREATKIKAVEKTKALLTKIVDVGWRQVILLRIEGPKSERAPSATDCAQENGLAVYSASCVLSYLRRERAKNPTGRGEIEREHWIEFEARLIRQRDRTMRFSGLETRAQKKAYADEVEAKARADREVLRHIQSPWTFERGEERELPYTAEAWAGLERIAQTLGAMQRQLNGFTSTAVGADLARLMVAPEDVFLLNGKSP